jgi:hypothetical protein
MFSRRPARLPRLVAIAVFIALVTALLSAAPASAAGGSIAGKVTKPDGKPHKGSTVDLYWADEDGVWFEKSTTTKSDGTYSFGSLRRGAYRVGFAPNSATYASEYWNNKTHAKAAANINIASTKVSGVNAKLEVGGKVAGRVLTEAAPSHPVAGVEVAAYRYDNGLWSFGKSVVTADDGSYNLGGLANGQWTLEFNPPQNGPDVDLALEYWGDSRVLDGNATFLVKPGLTVTGKDARLAEGGRISGRVTGPEGEPVVGALVFGYPSSSKDEVGNVAFTDDSGNYVMTGLSPGEHRLEFVDGLEFDPFGDGPKYAPEWWDDKGSFATANRVAVTAGSTSAGKDAQLDEANTPFASVTPPKVLGEPRVGEELTADPGAFRPHVDESVFRYQWLVEGNSTPVASGRSSTYTPTENHAGKRITVSVWAIDPGGQTASATSAPTEPVLKGVLRNITKPSYEGELRVGSKISVTRGTWNVYVEGYPELLADGEKVVQPGSELGPDLIGKRLSVRMTATSVGYEPLTVIGEETEPVKPGVFEPVELTVPEQPIVGVRSTVEHAFPDGTGSRYFSYQWFADGTEIPGAKYEDFYPTAAEVEKALTVRVSRSRPGFETLEQVSEPTEPVAARDALKLTTTAVPEISGLTTVGHALKPEGGQWTPSASEVTYEWLADGELIGQFYEFTPTTAHLGKRISVRATARRNGYVSATVTSAETAPITIGTPFGPPTGAALTSHTVSSVGLKWHEVDGAEKYRLAHRPATSTGSFTTVDASGPSITLTGLQPGTEYEVKAAAVRADGEVSDSVTWHPSTLPLGPPGDFRVTQKSKTSVTLAWSRFPGVPKYRIWHGIGSGTRTKTEVGDVETVTIKGLQSGKTYSIDIASLLNDGTRSSYTPRIKVTTN